MLYADQKTYLVELLMKQDQMSMACSIESRVPFLDHPVRRIRRARCRRSMKHARQQGKYILKNAVEDLLPESIIYRKKMGFPTPLRRWLLDDRAEALGRLPARSRRHSGTYVNPDFVDDCWRNTTAASTMPPIASGGC